MKWRMTAVVPCGAGRWGTALCLALCLYLCLAGPAADAAEADAPDVEALCSEAEAIDSTESLAAFEAALAARLGLDNEAYEAAGRRRDAADGAYFNLLRRLADAIQSRMAETWAAARAAEQAFAGAPEGEAGAQARAAAQAAADEARRTLDDLSRQFAATPAEQAIAIGPEMVAAYDATVVEQAAAREALAALEAARAPLLAMERAVTQCIGRQRQLLLAEQQRQEELRRQDELQRQEAERAAKQPWTGTGGYLATCRKATFNHTGRIELTRQPDGQLTVVLVPERGGGSVSLDGWMDAIGRVSIAQNVGEALWMLSGTMLPHPEQAGRLQGSGTGRFTNALHGLDCTVQWQTDP